MDLEFFAGGAWLKALERLFKFFSYKILLKKCFLKILFSLIAHYFLELFFIIHIDNKISKEKLISLSSCFRNK